MASVSYGCGGRSLPVPDAAVEGAGGETGAAPPDAAAEGSEDAQNQIVEPLYQILEIEPQPTGNHATTKREEKAAVKRALQNAFVLPVHDYPARIEAGRVVARLKDTDPGPEEPVTMKTPSETGSIVGADALPHDVLIPTGV